MSDAEFHRKYSTACFNDVWSLIDKTNRAESDDRDMLLRAYASLWHWTQRQDCSPKNLSIGWWQIARVHALLGDAKSAYRAAAASLAHAQEQSPFLVGYAHEAFARAAGVANDADRRARHLEEAHRYLAKISNEKERSMLAADLESISKNAA